MLYVKSVATGDYDAPEGYADESITCTAVASTTKTYTLTFPDGNSKGISSYTDTWSATIDNKTWSIANFNNNNNNWEYIKCGRGAKKGTGVASIATIATDWAITEDITKIILTIDKIDKTYVNSIKLTVASDSNFSNNIQTIEIDDLSIGDKTCIVPTPTSNCYYKLTFDCKSGASSNGFVQISKIVYTNAE